MVTPTGAAIIRDIAAEFGPLPAMTVESIGYGAGKSDFSIPNALRVMIGEATASPFSGATVEDNIFDNTTVATAIADRLVHNSEVIVMEGPSYRTKNKS